LDVSDVENYTPHDIVVRPSEGEEIIIQASGWVARLEERGRPADPIIIGDIKIPVWNKRYGRVYLTDRNGNQKPFPPYSPGKAVIVSLPVAQALSGRPDIFCPDTGPRSAIRGRDGRVEAVKRLMQVV